MLQFTNFSDCKLLIERTDGSYRIRLDNFEISQCSRDLMDEMYSIFEDILEFFDKFLSTAAFSKKNLRLQ